MRALSASVGRLLVALLLVTTPFWGPALELTGSDYVYESAEIRVEENRLVVPDESVRFDAHHGISGFACSLYSAQTRYCTLEATTLNGSVGVEHPDVTRSTSGYLPTEDEYLAYGDGRVYAFNSTWEDGEYVLSTERVSAESALDDVAQSLTTYPSPPAARAIRQGSAVADDELWADSAEARVFELDGEYYLVYQAARTRFLAPNPDAEAALSFFAVLYGVAMLYRQGRRDT